MDIKSGFGLVGQSQKINYKKLKKPRKLKRLKKYKGKLNYKEVINESEKLFSRLEELNVPTKIEAINKLRSILHKHSPFSEEPVDFVQWVPINKIEANDYNPNIVAPPEMKLLERSIKEDGYTQPIVAWYRNDNYEIIDGFHRHRVGRECKIITEKVKGYLPLTIINTNGQESKGNRIASTIRHNRARGKHTIMGMSDIVLELKNRNWTNERIAKNLGMDQDEILRLCQITGLTKLFADQGFSKSWDIEGDIDEHDFEELSDDVETYGEEVTNVRTVNTNDNTRIFHTWDKWECAKAGLYKTSKEGMTKEECEQAYCNFLSDLDRFAEALERVITEWKFSCEQYLTNSAMNRIAWLGQASMCYATGIPAAFRSGFYLLSEEQQIKANEKALIYLNKWLEKNNRKKVTMEEAESFSRQSDIY